MTDRYENIRKALARVCDPRAHPKRYTQERYTQALTKLRLACDPDTIRALLAEMDSLRDALEAAREDAERYRWLRDPCSGAERVIFYCRGDYGKGLMSGAMLDAAIDAAIDQARGKENGNG